MKKVHILTVTVDNDPALDTIEDILGLNEPIDKTVHDFLVRTVAGKKASLFKAVVDELDVGTLQGDVIFGAGIAYIQSQLDMGVIAGDTIAATTGGPIAQLLGILGMPGHDCETCAKYDDCVLPIKLARS